MDQFESDPMRYDRYLTSGQAADFLGISLRQLATWRDRGVVKTFQVGDIRTYRYRLDDLQALIRPATVSA